MAKDLLTVLAPMLTHRPRRRFNVFDVMHHGTHEKQLSNVFAWLLRADATHGLGDAFQRIFVEEVSCELVKRGGEPVPGQPFGVRQEVNTALPGEPEDIADLILDGEDVTIVIENYGVPDGHEHSYDGYLQFGTRQGRTRSVVVLLCESDLGGHLIDGWESAPVVPYARLLNRLYEHVEQLPAYRADNAEQFYFIENMHRHFTNGMALTMDREGLIEFVDALCRGGEAERFGQKQQEAVARELADRLREEAVQRYTEGRALLGKAKTILRDYCDAALAPQVNEVLGNVLGRAHGKGSGVNSWEVNIAPHPDWDREAGGSYVAHLVLGPSAWHAVTKGRWKGAPIPADFKRIMLLEDRPDGRAMLSEVTIADVLEGLSAEETRLQLRNEMVALLRP